MKLKKLPSSLNIKNKVICWWSGGVTSAVACKMAIDMYGVDNCLVLFIDTYNEHEDTYRFMFDCQKWYNSEIWTISNKKYTSIEDVWYDHLSLNVAHGAICSSELKRAARVNFERRNLIESQVFGFDIDEPKRAKNIKNNYPKANPIFPLLFKALSKKDCIAIIKSNGLEIPKMYKLGFTNNNCFGKSDTSLGGCVQGGIGYWKKIQLEFPEKFAKMAAVEHDLTNLKGKPVTCLKDQSKAAKESGQFKVFLLPHPNYPFHKSLDDMKGRPIENLLECNGFCGVQSELFKQV